MGGNCNGKKCTLEAFQTDPIFMLKSGFSCKSASRANPNFGSNLSGVREGNTALSTVRTFHATKQVIVELQPAVYFLEKRVQWFKLQRNDTLKQWIAIGFMHALYTHTHTQCKSLLPLFFMLVGLWDSPCSSKVLFGLLQGTTFFEWWLTSRVKIYLHLSYMLPVGYHAVSYFWRTQLPFWR